MERRRVLLLGAAACAACVAPRRPDTLDVVDPTDGFEAGDEDSLGVSDRPADLADASTVDASEVATTMDAREDQNAVDVTQEPTSDTSGDALTPTEVLEADTGALGDSAMDVPEERAVDATATDSADEPSLDATPGADGMDVVADAGSENLVTVDSPGTDASSTEEALALDGVAPEVAACPATALRLGALRDFERDRWRLLARDGLIVGHDARGLFVYSAMCTHRGCVVGTPDARGETLCGCHGSRFDGQGNVLEGPAMRSLEHYEALRCGDDLHVTDRLVPQDQRL